MYFHVWFVTKYRRPSLVGETDSKIKSFFAECIERHNYKVLEFETNIDHAHFLIEAADRHELSATMRTIKAVSAREIQKTARDSVNNRGREGYCRRKPAEAMSFWAKRFGSRKLNESEISTIREYVRNQRKIHKK